MEEHKRGDGRELQHITLDKVEVYHKIFLHWSYYKAGKMDEALAVNIFNREIKYRDKKSGKGHTESCVQQYRMVLKTLGQRFYKLNTFMLDAYLYGMAQCGIGRDSPHYNAFREAGQEVIDGMLEKYKDKVTPSHVAAVAATVKESFVTMGARELLGFMESNNVLADAMHINRATFYKMRNLVREYPMMDAVQKKLRDKVIPVLKTQVDKMTPYFREQFEEAYSEVRPLKRAKKK